MLTIAYMTNRRGCHFQWFCDSLWKQAEGQLAGIKIVVVDYWAWQEGRPCAFWENAKRLIEGGAEWVHVTPKPTVWQGKYRLTQQNYFAASNARNTAICLAPDGWLAYVDDLSVLLPGWLTRVRAAMAEGYVACGSYAKVRKLAVVDGELVSYERHAAGEDHRLAFMRRTYVHTEMPTLQPHEGSWFYGCSLAAPVQAFLDVNGWDEDCDSMGAEDYACGLMMARAGYKLMFDPNMTTYESEEDHFVEPPFLRIDKPNVMGCKDASNAYLKLLSEGRRRAPNYFGTEGLAGLRQRVLEGEPFPIMTIPEHDWRDGQPIREM